MQLRPTSFRFPLAAVAALALAACGDLSGPQDADPAPALSRAGLPPQANLDARLAEIARRAPAFGGLFLAPDGTPTMYLTDARQRASAEAAVRAVLDHPRVGGRELAVRQGRYGFGQLQGWMGALHGQLSDVRPLLADVDEAENRLWLGVPSEAARSRVLAQAARAGIPAAAITVEVTEPVEFAATLRDYGRPVVGGMQIAYSSYVCSVGYNVDPASDFEIFPHLLTAAHCSSTQGAVDGTNFYQNTVSSGNLIATENVDPAFFTGGACPAGRLCRYSDALLAQYPASGTPPWRIGAIARTANASLTVTGEWSIRGEQAYAVAGEQLTKVGRTTGTSSGSVVQACITVDIGSTSFLCQYAVDAAVDGGDSGGSVFKPTGVENQVTAYGILFARLGFTRFYFSPLGGIEQELGPLTTTFY